MYSFIGRLIIKSLKNSFLYDLQKTREEYHHLGNILFFGVGLVALAALLSVPHFENKYIVYIYTGYCFFTSIYNKFTAQGYPLAIAILQAPFGLAMILSLQFIMPVDLVGFTAFLFPIVFVFLYEFHTITYTRIMFLIALFGTALIGFSRDFPYLPAYLITTFGSTLIIGRVVRTAAEKTMLLANHDSLTGLMNRRHWEENLIQLFKISERTSSNISIAYMDLDGFKKINDESGHIEGDQTLQNFASILKKVGRDSDLIARWGGDEFVIAMPETDHQKAESMIKRLAHLSNNIPFSYGLAVYQSGETIDELLSRADEQMYKSKTARKNEKSNNTPSE